MHTRNPSLRIGNLFNMSFRTPRRGHGFKGTWFNLGRRGAMLYVLGVMWTLIGIGTVITGTAPSLPDTLLHVMLPHQVLGGLWVLTGLASIFYAYRVNDAFGFLALYLVPSFVTFSYLIGWLDFITPGLGGEGYARGIQSLLIYIIFILIIVICAGWPEPPKSPDEVLKGGDKK